MEFAALIALTVLIGMLIILVAIAVGKQKGEISEQLEQKEEDSVVEESAVKASTAKKQKQQRPRKEKAQQQTFSHPLLASSLKVGHASHTVNPILRHIKDDLLY
ncbi:unnamed protein product [Coregonus sp. 'balchen']|uniref:Uncharacterized protein n=1 Tax=Coregonus suidteri TaxID=861788 RepID=A0AAN8LXA0_9TELE|nr:unnamed protein product [Coregonus sp. 'balchen']